MAVSVTIENQTGTFPQLYWIVLLLKWLFVDPLNLKIKEIIAFFDDSVATSERLDGFQVIPCHL